MTFENALDAVSEWSHSLDRSHPSDGVGTVSCVERRVLIVGVFVPIFVSAISLLSTDECARFIGLVALAIAYFSLLLYQVVAFWRDRTFFKKIIGTPFDLLLDNIRHSAHYDELLLQNLRSCDLFVLERLVCKLNLERDHMEIRVNLLTGPLPKAGIVAGVFALILLYLKVATELSSWISNANWISSEILAVFAYAMLGLYLLAFNCYRPLMRSERAVRLAELVLADKQRSNPALQPTPLTRRG